MVLHLQVLNFKLVQTQVFKESHKSKTSVTCDIGNATGKTMTTYSE